MFRQKVSYVLTALFMPFILLSPAVVRAEDAATAVKKQEVKQKIEAIKIKSRERIEALKEKAEKKTTEVRTKACEARKSNIEKRLDDRVSAAKRHKEKFDAIYNKVKTFASDKSLSSADITTAETKVTAQGQKVNDEIAALEGLDISIDCTNPDNVATVIDTYREQLETTRSVIKEYREAIRVYAQTVKKLAEGENL